MGIEIKSDWKNEVLVGANTNDGIKSEFQISAENESGLGGRAKFEIKGGVSDESSDGTLLQSQFKSQFEIKIPGEAELYWKNADWRLSAGVLKPYRGTVANGLSAVGMKSSSALLREEYLPFGYQNPVSLDPKNSLGASLQWSHDEGDSGGRFFVLASNAGGSALLGGKLSPGEEQGTTEKEVLLPVDSEKEIVLSAGGGFRYGSKKQTHFALDGSGIFKWGTGESSYQLYAVGALEIPNSMTRFAGDVSVVGDFNSQLPVSVGSRLVVEQTFMEDDLVKMSLLTGVAHVSAPSLEDVTPTFDDEGDGNIIDVGGTAIVSQGKQEADETPEVPAPIVIQDNHETDLAVGYRMDFSLSDSAGLTFSPWAGGRWGTTVDETQPIYGITFYYAQKW